MPISQKSAAGLQKALGSVDAELVIPELNKFYGAEEVEIKNDAYTATLPVPAKYSDITLEKLQKDLGVLSKTGRALTLRIKRDPTGITMTLDLAERKLIPPKAS